jgi:hypothetical protein
MMQELTQEQAYEQLLQQAAQHKWTAVYEELMKDGFDVGFDYIQQLELWKWDSESEGTFDATY